MASKVIKVRRYKAGYEIRTSTIKLQLTQEIIPELDVPTVDVELPMKQAYTFSGHLVGSTRFAHYLIVKRGIMPELAGPGHKFCSIGFCEREQSWYGWSKRGLCGFSIDGVVKKEDWLMLFRGKSSKHPDVSSKNLSSVSIGFQAITFDDTKKMAIEFANIDQIGW